METLPIDNRYLIEQSKVFKYVPFEGAKSIVSSLKLKFSNPKDFNDPFDTDEDILDYDISNLGEDAKNDIDTTVASFLKRNNLNHSEHFKNAIQSLKNSSALIEAYKLSRQELIENTRTLCLSMDENNILLWSHYADKHNGICLEFDLNVGLENIFTETEIQMIGKVDYDRNEKINYLENKLNAICKLYLTKTNEWSYEKEVRIVILNDNQFQKFNKRFLTGIIFGCKVPTSAIDEFKELCYNNELHNLRYRKAVKRTFKLTIEEC